jgi:hypothetical protein
MVPGRFLNISSVAREASQKLGQTVTPGEVRFVCMYEHIPVYSDPKSRARFLDGTGYEWALRSLRKFTEGRRQYFEFKTHPEYKGANNEPDSDGTGAG